MPQQRDVYFSADIECDGPYPGRFSMLSFGLAVAGEFDGAEFRRSDPERRTFYRELRPISDAYEPDTAAVSGLDRERLLDEGDDPAKAMDAAAEWIEAAAAGGTPVLVAYPLSFDWSWLWWYFGVFGHRSSPFGYSNCYDIKTAYAVLSGTPIALSGKTKLPARFRSRRPHKHHAMADAIEQADIFANLLEWAASRRA